MENGVISISAALSMAGILLGVILALVGTLYKKLDGKSTVAIRLNEKGREEEKNERDKMWTAIHDFESNYKEQFQEVRDLMATHNLKNLQAIHALGEKLTDHMDTTLMRKSECRMLHEQTKST
jgi:hypothetical protein